MVLESKNKYDAYGLYKSLKSYSQLANKIPKNQMESTYKSIYGIIESNFEATAISDPAIDDWTRQTVTIINKSRTEQTSYDFKIGFYNLQTKTFSIDNLNKILKTLTAINNVSPNKKGYVIVGIADCEKDAKKYTDTFDLDSFMLEGDFPVIGIDHEVNMSGCSVDVYTKK